MLKKIGIALVVILGLLAVALGALLYVGLVPPFLGTDSPPVIENLVVDFGPFDSQTSKAGSILFTRGRLRPFLEFGAVVEGPQGPKILPTFEYRTVEGAKVYAPADGVLLNIRYQEETQDYELRFRPNRVSNWSFGIDHVLDPKVERGDKVESGQAIGVAGNWNGPGGRVELMVSKGSTSGGELHYCPTLLFAPEVSEDLKAQITQMMADWEDFSGDEEAYDESSQVAAGCTGEAFVENEEGVSPYQP